MSVHKSADAVHRGRVLAYVLATALGAVVACDPSAAGAADRSAAFGSDAEGNRVAAALPDTLRPVVVDIGHTMGDPDAPIAVVEFSDFGCPYCARFARTTLPEIQREFIDTGLVRWRYVPVTFGFAGGELMGAAAECAAREGGSEAFWEVHDLFYARQVALRGGDARPRLLDWLAELGLDRAELDACIDDPAIRALLERHNQGSQRWFVRGTPTFIVNGVPMSGALPIEFFRQVFATMLDPSGL